MKTCIVSKVFVHSLHYWLINIIYTIFLIFFTRKNRRNVWINIINKRCFVIWFYTFGITILFIRALNIIRNLPPIKIITIKKHFSVRYNFNMITICWMQLMNLPNNGNEKVIFHSFMRLFWRQDEIHNTKHYECCNSKTFSLDNLQYLIIFSIGSPSRNISSAISILALFCAS